MIRPLWISINQFKFVFCPEVNQEYHHVISFSHNSPFQYRHYNLYDTMVEYFSLRFILFTQYLTMIFISLPLRQISQLLPYWVRPKYLVCTHWAGGSTAGIWTHASLRICCHVLSSRDRWSLCRMITARKGLLKCPAPQDDDRCWILIESLYWK